MDISTLSQQLNMSVRELRARIKEAGFRVSPRARKVDNSLAKEIIQKLSGKMIAQKAPPPKPTKIQIPPLITVKDFSKLLNEPVSVVIKKLLQNGVMATINEEIDFDTAAIIASEFGIESEAETSPIHVFRLGFGYVQELLEKEDSSKLQLRPPIVAVMGHVDHGKTTLLDTIRKTNVVASEAGAITQHIGAYQVEHQGKLITFLDTPGHEAFAAMRARGANVTDIIVLVIAVDDGVKPQTVEVIHRAKLTKTPLVVALNKIDKPEANLDRVKRELMNFGVTVEDWGGTVPAVPISAKTGMGIDKLLEIILLTGELEELKANPEGQTVGTVIESHLSRGQGCMATVLVQNGTLKIGDFVNAGTTFGKVRTMQDASGKRLKLATPSTPVQVSGLSSIPGAGDILKVTRSLEEAREQAIVLQKFERAKRLRSRPVIKTDPNKKELKLIIRADVQGSLEAITDALSKLGDEEVKLTIVDAAIGDINESDVQLAENTDSIIIGFHTRVTVGAAKLAKQKNITIDQYDIIYELLEDLTSALLAMIPTEVVKTMIGRVKIKAIFRTEPQMMIVGGEVIEGEIVEKKKFNIIRDKQFVGEGKVEELQHNKVEVSEVGIGKEFGLKAQIGQSIEIGDILEVYDETVKKKESLTPLTL